MAIFQSSSFGSLLLSALKYTLGAGVVAAIINLILYNVVGMPQDILAVDGKEPIAMSHMVMSAIVPAIGAGVLFAILAKFTNRPFLIFNIIATIFFVYMFFRPLDIPNVTGKMAGLLEVMHVVVACAIVYALNNMLGSKLEESNVPT